MIRKDYFLRIVEEFARMIAAIIGLKNDGKYEEAQKKIDSVYTVLLGIEPVAVKAIGADEVVDFLLKEQKLSNAYLKMIAELMFEEGRVYSALGDPVSAANLLEKAREIINYLIKNDPTFSFDWYEKLNLIDQIIGDN